jgi:hypothetical protein
VLGWSRGSSALRRSWSWMARLFVSHADGFAAL